MHPFFSKNINLTQLLNTLLFLFSNFDCHAVLFDSIFYKECYLHIHKVERNPELISGINLKVNELLKALVY